ncbi:MAG: response regulator transcription factor [Bacteroidota bacterium]
MIQVLVADDHHFLLDGFASIVQGIDDINLSATATNGKQVLELLDKESIDIALLDINMPLLNGVETCKSIQKKHAEVKVLALSMHKRQSFVKRMLQYGAKGYILKDDPAQHIIDGIRTVHAGGTYFSPRVKDIALSFVPSSRDALLSITDREIEVLQLISLGITNQEIANRLYLSPHTTETHRRHLLNKLDARNTAELVRKGIEKGLI